jgi:integrase
MTVAVPAAVPARAAAAWSWPAGLGRYRRQGELTAAELDGLRMLGPALLQRGGCDPAALPWQPVRRLLGPLDAARAALHWHPDTARQRRFARDAAGLVLMRCADLQRAYWDWEARDWAGLIGAGSGMLRDSHPGQTGSNARPYVLAYAYLIGEFTAFDTIGRFYRQSLAWRAFGRELVDDAVRQIRDVLAGWGYRCRGPVLAAVICQMLLLNRSPMLEDLTAEVLVQLRADPAMGWYLRRDVHGIHRAVAALGYAAPPPAPKYTSGPVTIKGAPQEWVEWVERWYSTSALTPKVRGIYRVTLAQMGRCLAAGHPGITRPAEWTRQTCAAWVAAVDRMSTGDYAQWHGGFGDRAGKPLSPQTKAGYLRTARTFFRDCQEWEWIPRRFDPARALATPRSVQALVGPDPRVIADDVWAKLLWAGLNLDAGDVPAADGRTHPAELIRALALTWLFSGQRSDELARLRVGCIRWQHDGMPIPGDSGDVLARDAVCLLDVPTHKTGTAFTKPVDPLVGQAIQAWQAIRPSQPAMADHKTGEHVDFLFAHRARRVSKHYINEAIIPMLCRKAGVPTADVRGNITSHRARSTIASQLYNAKEPMTLFELQEWLGHRSPEATQHYARITPNTLARAYRDAGYFARNVRTIEVLLDRDAITSGAAATGTPWQYYDLGHGYCTYTFFEQCPHRMACARCDFYAPKASARAQLLEAKDNLQHMLVSVPLTDDERAAVDDGQEALSQLLKRLADVPTPAGSTPAQIGLPQSATLLPIADVRHGQNGQP